MRAFAVNLLLATLWAFAGEAPTPAAFARGFLAGFLLLALFQGLLGDTGYTRRAWAAVRFAAAFAKELVVSNLQIARAVLFRPVGSLAPGFVEYDTRGLTAAEVLVLSHCISLTPGTTTVEVAEDRSRLLLHVFDAEDAEAVRRSIRENLEGPLLAVTR